MEVNCQLHASSASLPGKIISTNFIGIWLGPRISLGAVAKKKSFQYSGRNWIPVVEPVSESLYWLSYFGFQQWVYYQKSVNIYVSCLVHVIIFHNIKFRTISCKVLILFTVLMITYLNTMNQLSILEKIFCTSLFYINVHTIDVCTFQEICYLKIFRLPH